MVLKFLFYVIKKLVQSNICVSGQGHGETRYHIVKNISIFQMNLICA